MQTTFTDLTGCQWEIIKKRLKSHRPRQHSLRTIINAILCLSRTGSQWRNLESRYPPWQSISSSFRLWQENGLWDRLLSSLVQQERIRQGRESDTTQKPPSEKGFVPQEGKADGPSSAHLDGCSSLEDWQEKRCISEKISQSARAFLQIAFINVMLNRLG